MRDLCDVRAKLEVVMGGKGSVRAKSAKPAPEKSPKNPSFVVPPETHARIRVLAGLLGMSMPEAIEWLLQLDHPQLRRVRRAFEEEHQGEG